MTKKELTLKNKGYAVIYETTDWDSMFSYVLEKRKTIPNDSTITFDKKEKVFRLWIKEVK